MSINITNTITTGTIRAKCILSSDTFTVEDEAGLEALPVGTILRDRDSSAGYDWIRTEYGAIYGADRNSGSTRGLDLGSGSGNWSTSALGRSDWLPMTVRNPEILGEFFPEHDFEYVTDHRLSGDLKKGDLARITSSGNARGKWTGLIVVVKVDQGADTVWVTPTAPRPDGYGLAAFLWHTDRLERVVEVSKPTPLEVLDGLPNGTIIKLNDAGMTGGTAYRLKRRGEWLSVAGEFDSDEPHGPFETSDPWTSVTRYYVEKGTEYDVVFQVPAA